MLDDFFYRALIAGCGVALIAAPLGCFIVWKRMAYLGETMSHSALLGVAMGFLLGVDLVIGVFVVALVIALILFALQKQKQIANDTILGILSHTSLALGILILSLMTWLQIDLTSYLFGDILAVNISDVYLIYFAGAIILALLLWLWKPLLAITVDKELVQAEGVPVLKYELIFMLLIAAVTALSMKVIGALLVTSLLIIPATTARYFSNTPEKMAAVAAVVGLISVIGGLNISLYLNTPSGPSIVIVAASLFFVSLLTRPLT